MIVRTFGAALVLFGCLLAPLGAQAQTKPLPYRIYADVVADRLCIPRTTFNPGDTIIFRAEIDDAAGVKLTAAQIKALGITAVVSMKDGTNVPLALGVHPPFPNAPLTDLYWDGAWHTKPDHPTGTLPWTLTVKDAAGNVVTFQPIGQSNGASVLTLAEKGVAAPTKS